MRSKQISADEQFLLIMECRQSGLSEYQWCQMNDINPGTFYNWISRLRKRGMVIPMSSDQGKKTSAPLQEVVKVNLMPDSAPMLQVEQNATIRFFHNTDKSMIETTLKCMGGVMLC